MSEHSIAPSQNALLVLRLLMEGRDSDSITEATPMLSRNIAALLHFDGKERTVRECVHELRLRGHGLCSGDKGYWLAKNMKETIPTIRVMLAKSKQTRLPAIALAPIYHTQQNGGEA